MIVTEVIPLDKKKYKITVEGGETFTLYRGELRRFQIESGAVLKEETLQQIYDEVLKKRVKERSLYLLKSMDRTEYEIAVKLRQGFYPQELIDYALDFLKKYGYVDDKRYIENYIHANSGRKSRRIIIQKLQQKGLSKELIESVQADMEEETSEHDETSMIYSLLEKKHYNPDCDYKEKNRIISFLLRRGFEMEDILSCMKKLKT